MTAVDLAKYTYLVVEDQKLTRIQMVNMMKGIGIPAVLTAENGEQAIEIMCNPTHLQVQEICGG